MERSKPCASRILGDIRGTTANKSLTSPRLFWHERSDGFPPSLPPIFSIAGEDRTPWSDAVYGRQIAETRGAG